MAHFKLMPDVVDLREVTFTNILLLGFDVDQNEAQYRVPFHRDMFSVPNRKGMEVVLHFLFSKLNSDSAKESFRNCWPLIDKKKEQEFRKICTEWLTKIKKDDLESRIPTIVPSLLISPGGNKFYQFLFYFSIYVLKHKISRFPAKYGGLPSWPSISTANKKYLPQLVRSLTVSAINKKARLIAFMDSLTATKDEWVKFAREQSKEHRKLSKLRRDCEREIKELKVAQEQIFGKGAITSKEPLKRTQKLQKTTEFWKTISKLFEAEKCLQEKVNEIVDTKKEKKSLDGHVINFKVPDILLKECEKQLQAGKRYENVYDSGKVNILSLVQLWNLSLHLVKEALSHFPLPNIEQDESYIRAEAHNHANNLDTYMTLSNSLSKHLLPDLRLSTDELKENIREKSDTTPQFKQFGNKFDFDFLPATPPVYFEADSSGFLFNNQHLQKHQYVDTPDAVDVLLHRIRKDANKLSGEHQDDTPVRGFPKSMMAASTSKKSTKAFFREKVPTREQTKETNGHVSKIPLPSNSSKLHLSTKNNPTKLAFKTPVTKKISQETPTATVRVSPKTPEKKAQKIEQRKERMQRPMATPNGKVETTAQITETMDQFGTKAQQLLVDQIAQSVLNQTELSDCTGSDTEDTVEVMEDQGRLHALDDPIEAFNTNAFESRDKVPRTPARKNHTEYDETNNERVYSPDLQHQEATEEILPEDIIGIQNSHVLNGISPSPEDTNVVSSSSSLSSSFDLKSLQGRIDEIKSRVERQVHTNASVFKDQQPLENGGHLNGFLLPGIQCATPSSNSYHPSDNVAFISPLHDIRTPIGTYQYSTNHDDSTTPLHELDSNLNMLALGDVDFTPIKTPWKSKFGTSNNSPRPTEASENTERNVGTSNLNDGLKNLLLFTPVQEDPSSTIRMPTNSTNSYSKDNTRKDKSDIELFYENNKRIITPGALKDDASLSIQSINKSNKGRYTPAAVNKTPINLMTFITPFKDPNSPTNDDTIRTPVNLNISIEEVDDFIDEVMTNTSKHATSSFIPTKKNVLNKTPGLFNVKEPAGINNDYSLMTPGGAQYKPFRLDFSDDEDEL